MSKLLGGQKKRSFEKCEAIRDLFGHDYVSDKSIFCSNDNENYISLF